MSAGSVAPLTFNNTEFKACDPTQPNPVDCIMKQSIGAPNGVVKRTNVQQTLAQQSWPAAISPTTSSASFENGVLAGWHTPALGYFNSEQAALCGSALRAGLDNTCWAGGAQANGVPITPAMLSAPYSKNPGPWNMDNGRYLYQLTQPVPPLTGMSTSEVLVRDQ
jgi:hypothetical protein